MFVKVPVDEKVTLSDLYPFETVPLMSNVPFMVGSGSAILILSALVICTETMALPAYEVSLT